MSSRVFGLLFLCVLSALVVGVTSAGSASGADPAAGEQSAVLAQHALSWVRLERADVLHTASLLLGIAALVHTYRKVWRNLRESE